MTRQRNDNHSTEFGLWLRQQKEIDSSLGYVTTNLDYVWRNFITGEWMCIEEKRHGAYLTDSQVETFKLIDIAARNDPKYRGFHRIRFENTSPDDGRIWLDGREVDAKALIGFLQFKSISGRHFQAASPMKHRAGNDYAALPANRCVLCGAPYKNDPDVGPMRSCRCAIHAHAAYSKPSRKAQMGSYREAADDAPLKLHAAALKDVAEGYAEPEPEVALPDAE